MFNKLKNKLVETWYSFRAEHLLQNLPFFNMMNIIRENGDKTTKNETPTTRKDWIYIIEHGENSFTLYYDLIRIVIENNNNKLIQVTVLKPGSTWSFNDEKQDISETFEIYTWYDVEVLIGQRCSGERYLKGNWNEYVYTTTKKLYERVNSWTEYNSFNRAFKENVFQQTER